MRNQENNVDKLKKPGGNTVCRAVLAVTAALAMLLFYLAAAAWGGLLGAESAVLFYLEQPLGFGEAQEIIGQNEKIKEKSRQGETEETSLPDFCIWGEKKDILLTNENLSRTAQVNAVLLCGDPELLFEDCRVPVREDVKGCVIDGQTAWELYGSSQVVGKELSCEGQSYIVRRVISSKEKIIAYQVFSPSESGDSGQKNEGQGDMLDRITVQKQGDSSSSGLVSVWLYQYGISVKTLDLELLRGISGFCVLLFPVVLCMFFWRYLWGIAKKIHTSSKWLQRLLKIGISLLLPALVLLFLRKWVRIPADYIPTRWSDFSFWSELWEEKSEGVRFLFEMPKAALDESWMTEVFQSVSCGLLAGGLLVLVGIAGFLLDRRREQ